MKYLFDLFGFEGLLGCDRRVHFRKWLRKRVYRKFRSQIYPFFKLLAFELLRLGAPGDVVIVFSGIFHHEH